MNRYLCDNCIHQEVCGYSEDVMEIRSQVNELVDEIDILRVTLRCGKMLPRTAVLVRE